MDVVIVAARGALGISLARYHERLIGPEKPRRGADNQVCCTSVLGCKVSKQHIALFNEFYFLQ